MPLTHRVDAPDATTRAKEIQVARGWVIERVLGQRGPSGLIWIVGVSALVGAVASQSAGFASLHALATLAAVVGLSLWSPRLAPVLGVTAYAGVCDVFWRMTGAVGPYEGAKYALIVGFGAILVRFVRRPRRAGLPVLLILMLVPGALLGMAELGPSVARQYLAANLSGLVALALGVLVCSNIRVTPRDIRFLYLAALGPSVSVALVATLATATADDLQFTNASNFTTAAGFGPNQVSAVLCFGSLLCILLMLQRGVTSRVRLLALATGTWLAAQAVLTFSRGGLFGLVLAAACVGLAALTLKGQRVRTLLAAGLLIIVALQVLSWAGTFTGGVSEERFSSTDATNRTDIARADLKVFYAHPISGVGVGRLQTERDFGVEAAPHTEYTRLLAEHGIAGVAVACLLIAMSLRIVRSADDWFRMAAVGLVVLSLVQMSHSATRIGSIALAFGLAALRGDRG